MSLDQTLRELVKGIVQEVVAECGQTAAPQLYDVDQAAARLSVPRRWLYEKTAAGTIPFRKIGKYLRFSDADLIEIAKRQSG